MMIGMRRSTTLSNDMIGQIAFHPYGLFLVGNPYDDPDQSIQPMSRSRKRQRLALTVDELVLTEFGFAEGSSGVIFFLALPGRNIHLTYYQRDGLINCHIKDSRKQPSTVWEIEMSEQELLGVVERSLRRTISRYNWNETYLMFQKPLFDFMNQLSPAYGENGRSSFNLLDTLRIFSSVRKEEDLLVRTRIREGLKLGNLPGFQFSMTQSYILFPLDAQYCFRMNADFKKSILGKTPFGIGILEYFKYLERELTGADVEAFLDKDTAEKAKVAMEAALLSSTTTISPLQRES